MLQVLVHHEKKCKTQHFQNQFIPFVPPIEIEVMEIDAYYNIGILASRLNGGNRFWECWMRPISKDTLSKMI